MVVQVRDKEGLIVWGQAKYVHLNIPDIKKFYKKISDCSKYPYFFMLSPNIYNEESNNIIRCNCIELTNNGDFRMDITSEWVRIYTRSWKTEKIVVKRLLKLLKE